MGNPIYLAFNVGGVQTFKNDSIKVGYLPRQIRPNPFNCRYLGCKGNEAILFSSV